MRWQPHHAMIECFLSCVLSHWQMRAMLKPNRNWRATKTIFHWIIKTLSHCCGNNDLKTKTGKFSAQFFLCRRHSLSLFTNFLNVQFWNSAWFRLQLNMATLKRISCWMCFRPIFSFIVGAKSQVKLNHYHTLKIRKWFDIKVWIWGKKTGERMSIVHNETLQLE